MAQDHVSTQGEFFGINPGNESTNAPGGGSGLYGADPGQASTGAPGSHSAGLTGNRDPVSGVSASAATGSVGYFPGVGDREDAADLYRPASFGADNPSSTGAGEGSVGHSHNGRP